jgi:HPt (histidine-containing phosphotransfer) domain-containing protein
MINFDDSTPVLDLTVINQLRSIDPQGKNNLLKRLVDLYLESAPGVLSELHQDVTKPDIEHLKHLVHRFKTTNANLGLKRMHQILLHLESDKFNNGDQIKLVQQLDAELKSAMSALRNL